MFLAAGLEHRTLQAIEAGTANPALGTLLPLAYVLDVSLGDLVR
ncbi:helix-turn-helix transcriptional regulator [Streptomyces sp. MBT65]|nr:helix-turn-helix transcriptional regulator [Streptomyces sp. MBT65]